MSNETNVDLPAREMAGSVDCEGWLKARLMANDDASIDRILSNSPTEIAGNLLGSVRSLVEEQHIELAGRAFAVSLFAIPVVVRAPSTIAEENYMLTIDSHVERTFQEYGLLDKSVGVVVLNRLVGHEQLSSIPHSALFQLPSQLLRRALQGGGEVELAGKDALLPTGFTLRDGVGSICYVVGVLFRRPSAAPPSLLADASGEKFERWRRDFSGLLSLLLSSSPGSRVSAHVTAPGRFYSAILNGAQSTISLVLGDHLAAISDLGEQADISMRTMASATGIGESVFAVDVWNYSRQTCWSFSMNTRMHDSARIQAIYDTVGTLLLENKMQLASRSYASHLMCGGSSIYLH